MVVTPSCNTVLRFIPASDACFRPTLDLKRFFSTLIDFSNCAAIDIMCEILEGVLASWFSATAQYGSRLSRLFPVYRMTFSSASGHDMSELKEELKGLKEQKAAELHKEFPNILLLGELNKDLDRVQAAITKMTCAAIAALSSGEH